METALVETLMAWIDSLRAEFAVRGELRDRWAEVERSMEFAGQVEHRFGDPTLARAALLVDVPMPLLRRELAAGLVDDEVFRTLEGVERLQSLAHTSGDVTEQLLADVLPSLSDPRSHLLFVVRQVYRIDADERFSRWLRAFLHAGQSETEEPPAPPGLHIVPEDIDHQFLSRVVAPTASVSGLWHERNVIEDFALRLRDPGRFEALATFAGSERVRNALEQRMARVREVVAGQADVRWEWHHFERMSQRLSHGSPDRAWLGHLGEVGFVSLVCTDVAECYRLMGLVHQHFRYQERGKLRDLLSEPTLTGYRSLHTEVELAVTDPARPERMSVRLLPPDAEEERFRPADNHTLARLRATISGGGAHATAALPLVVFTPDRRPIRLPAGATVLNFAAAIHHRLMILARGARVNQESRGLLHRLSPGDVVWLDVADIPRPLPRGWELHVPPETVSWLRKLYRRTYVSELAGRGRHWLREQLLQRYLVGELPDDPQLDTLTRVAQRGLRAGPPRDDDEQWWLRQLGIFDALEHDQQLPNELLITPEQREALLQRIAEQIELHAILLQLGRDPLEGAFLLEVCALCQLTSADTECMAVVAGHRIVLHQPDAPCGCDGTPVRRLSGEQAQYIVVEGSDRAGLAGEVLQACAKDGVGLMEISAVRAPGGRGLIRLRLDSVGPVLRDRLLRVLLHINGVKLVAPPSAPPSDTELRLLPPRAGAEPAAVVQEPEPVAPPSTPPFACGSYIISEKHFYGMVTERDQILAVVRDASSYNSPRGGRVFLQGPLKTGKSSLAHAVLRDLRLQEYPPCVTAYCAALVDEPWSDYRRRLGEELLEVAREAAAIEGRELRNDLEALPLDELVLAIRKGLGRSVVLVIDEVVQMFRATQEAGETRELERFRDFIDSTSGLVVIFVGPSAPVRRLQRSLRRILSTSEEVTPPRFREEEIADMLRAAKTGANLRIRFPRSIPNHLRTLTAGNPYWISALITRMWKTAIERDPGKIVYNRGLIRAAMEMTIRDGDYFTDRYDPVPRWPKWKLRALRLVLEACAQHRHRRTMTTVVLSKAEIVAVVAPALAPRLSSEEHSGVVDELLEELAARGAVRSRSRSHRDTSSRWEIGAPIFAAHIHAIRDRDDWLG